ncbi:Pectinesterase catalytic [Penicillium odoratum]|uniref:Pectinesterase catalytic n=1 Tax=Penicillium odoratum TaxID=1167516 RepID=UPI0025498CFD|nr:Pectinesterase catalytic [Penicillium odoratum]KAJ5777156.1 Pectinesterase catalytic [Penicillium odoratum]
MRLLSVLGIVGLAAAATTTATSTATATSTSTSSTSTASPTSTTAVTVATDGSAQFTAIGDAILYAQSNGIPTVTVSAGTYTQSFTISATPTVTVIGQSSDENDYSGNEVTITNSGVQTPGTLLTVNNNVKQVTFKNINFQNTATALGAMILKGNKYAFYDCQIVSTGSLAVTASVGLGVIANSYIEAADKIIYGGANIYVYNTKIVPTDNNALVAYMKGTTSTAGSVLYNSTVVFDQVTVAQKSGASNTNVYLASANGAGIVVVYRDSVLGSFIAASGAHVDTITLDGYNFFGEYANTGSGAYSSNSATRSKYVSLLDASDLSDYSLAAVFAAANPTYASSDITWVDSSVLAAIESADVITTTSVASTTAAATTASSAATTSTAATSTTSSAATATSTFVVDATSGPYKNVTAAIAALPSDGEEYTIYIKSGTYNEQISITRTGKTILRGETTYENDYTENTVTIEYSNGELTSAGEDETTPVVNAKNTDGKGLAIYNIDFKNTYPQTANTAALAADFYGTVQAYGCSFIGYQDTLLANKGTQVFSNCYIEGSIDYIWGFSTAYFYQSVIATNTAGACVAAMSRASATTAGGYVFDKCVVTYTSTYGSTYEDTWLGRPYSEYSRVVYMNSYIDKHINPAGWHIWSTSAPQTDYVTFGEFNNTGPSSWSSSRASFATNLTETEAEAYTLANWIGDTTWLDMDAFNYVPSYSLTGDASTTTTTTTTTSVSTSTSTATASWTHPTSGTTPPTGAVLVSVSGVIDGSYSNLTDALASLPDDTTTQVIFMYAGTYDEQVPSIDRDGPVMIIGYTTGNPGQSYADNEVTITFSRGLSVSPLPTGHSDAETATVSTASTQIAFYNVNIINSDNLDGSESSYVTLAASIYGTHIAFYGVYMQGWQDTLLTGSTTGYQYYESSYIEGAIDFIWGYSKAYFKGCTIGAKRAKSAMTAQSRASSSAIGGYIFDQTLFTAAADATVDLTETVYLGRPYSEYALVIIKNSYITDVINPSGWKVWSTTDPRTDYVTFGEYNNSGPGNWENNEAAREAFGYATLLTEDNYSLESVMDSTDWIDMTYWDSIDTPTSVSGTATATATATATTTTATATATSAYDGTTPPTGAYIVSKSSLGSNTTYYDTIQSALDAIPTSSKVTPTIFIYPGTYEEQLVISKSGSVILAGYSESTYDYSSNQVTIQYNRGVDTQADESNSDSATVYATGNYFQAININFVNNNGTEDDVASLGFAVKSSKYASLYGCQVTGNQDALLINGYFWMSNSYVEGNIDMIWGSGAGYFLNTTISPNEDGINLTADKRTTSTTAGGFVFDQCTIIPSTGAGTMSKISLGRPWNEYARVAYIDSYLDSCVEAAGWNEWSSSSPQTSGVTFAEYNNYGPGSSTSKRATFSTQLNSTGAEQFEVANFFATTSWIDFTHVFGVPFVPDQSTTTTSVSVSTATPTSTSISTETVTTTIDVVTTTTSDIVAIITPTDKTSTVKSTITLTITPDVVSATTTAKSTITTTETVTEPTKLTTTTSIVTIDVGSTVTPDATTVTSTVKSTTTDTVTVTGKATTTTVKSTLTTTSTVTAEASTSTVTDIATVTSVKTTSAKAGKTTSTEFVTVGSGGTTTISTKATTSTVTSTSTKTTTKTVTTTISCDAATKKKRDLVPRAITAKVTAYTTSVDVVTKTSTSTLAAATDYVTSFVTKTTSIKASTITSTVTSLATKVASTTIPAVTSTVTTVETTSVGKTTTLKASTVTSTITTASVKTQTVTSPGETVTTTSVKTTGVKSTLSLPASTTTITKTTTIKSTTTLPATTSTVIKTSTVTNEPSVTITERATSTSTKVVSTTSTATVTATKTAKCS